MQDHSYSVDSWVKFIIAFVVTIINYRKSFHEAAPPRELIIVVTPKLDEDSLLLSKFKIFLIGFLYSKLSCTMVFI